MSLKKLNINFKSKDEFLAQIKSALTENKKANDNFDELVFDDISSFKRFMSSNKVEVLMAISRRNPESIYQLAKIVNRQYPHVLKDVKQLQNFGFIKLVDCNGDKKQIRPELLFDYDMIKVNSYLEEIFPISAKSNQILLEAMVG